VGVRSATRSQILVALRRWMPNVSVRKLGDLIDRAKLVELDNKGAPSAILAFGLVLDGTIRVMVEGGDTRWVGPGEVFGMAQYQLSQGDMRLLLTSTTKTAHYLAFTHANVATQGLVRRAPPLT
jgi:hypothetical protein